VGRPIAAVLVALAVGLGLLLPWAEGHYGWQLGLSYDASTAQSTLAAIAGGMITLTGFILAALALVIQTVQSQSPRLLRALDRTERSPLLFGMLSATFTFALVVQSQVRSDAVPSTSVTLAIVLVLVSIALFLRMLVTVRAALTVGGLTRRIGDEVRRVVESYYPFPDEATDDVRGPSASGEPQWRTVRHHGRPGVFRSLDQDALVRLAGAADAEVTFVTAIGDFVGHRRLHRILALALDEIRLYDGASLQVARRLRALLDDLLAAAPPLRKPAVQERLDLLDDAVRHAFAAPADAARAAIADHQGIGSPRTHRSPDTGNRASP
jgi:uncharacterized membrane protein